MSLLGSLPRSFPSGIEEFSDRGSRRPESSFTMLNSGAASSLNGGGEVADLGRMGRGSWSSNRDFLRGGGGDIDDLLCLEPS